MAEGTRESCTCHVCRAACSEQPGWFLPGEAEKVADYLKLSLQELFDSRLGVDWRDLYEPIFVLAPALVDEEPGEEYPGNPKGRCVFFKDGRCEIHEVKPYECREYLHYDEVRERHEETARAWLEHQSQIRELLGREPIANEYFGGGFFGFGSS
jgi:Fe-S-cluster containining protein